VGDLGNDSGKQVLIGLKAEFKCVCMKSQFG